MVATVVSAVAAVVVTSLAGWVAGLGVGIVVAVVSGALVRDARRRKVLALADELRGWRAHPDRHVLSASHDPELDVLRNALDAAGADFDRRLTAMADQLPWRRALVEALPTAAVLFDGDGYVAAANPAARQLLSIASDGEPTTMLAALGSAQLASTVRTVRRAGAPVTVDADVSGRVVRATVTTIGAQRLVLVEDRSRERRLENLRRNFVVNASHELKTPATSIQALAEALQVVLDREPARVPGLLVRLEEESTRLVHLVHDMLDLRRLEDRVVVDREPVDLVPLVHAVVDEVAPRAEANGVVVGVETPAVALVHADPDDLRLVVRNLVINAVQYNRIGGELAVHLGEQDGAMELQVSDTGIGIPKADLDRVFERFYRVDVARSRETGGTGLGLALVRHAVTRNGGTIEVESLLGSRSTFTVRLPWVPAPISTGTGPDPSPGRVARNGAAEAGDRAPDAEPLVADASTSSAGVAASRPDRTPHQSPDRSPDGSPEGPGTTSGASE